MPGRGVVPRTGWRTPGTPLGGRIAHVVGVRAEKEMLRIDAGRVVAPVTDEQLGRYRPVMLLVALPMHVALAVAAVPVGRTTARPKPARPGLVYSRPVHVRRIALFLVVLQV